MKTFWNKLRGLIHGISRITVLIKKICSSSGRWRDRSSRSMMQLAWTTWTSGGSYTQTWCPRKSSLTRNSSRRYLSSRWHKVARRELPSTVRSCLTSRHRSTWRLNSSGSAFSTWNMTCIRIQWFYISCFRFAHLFTMWSTSTRTSCSTLWQEDKDQRFMKAKFQELSLIWLKDAGRRIRKRDLLSQRLWKTSWTTKASSSISIQAMKTCLMNM